MYVMVDKDGKVMNEVTIANNLPEVNEQSILPLSITSYETTASSKTTAATTTTATATKTGDSSPVALLFALVVISGIGIAVLSRRKHTI